MSKRHRRSRSQVYALFAAAIALTQPGHSGKTYSLVGPKAWTGEGIAEALTKHLGKQVAYGGDDLKAWSAQMRAFLPGWLAESVSAELVANG